MSDRKLILFSGGLDSTYLLWKALQEGPVDVISVTANQWPKKAAAEEAAREAILNVAERLTDRCVGYNLHVDYRELFSKHFVAPAFAQPIQWIYGALQEVNPARHSVLEIGYVAGDQILSELHNIRQAWLSLQAFSKKGPEVPIEFPLRFVTKMDIVEDMPVELLELVWYCESPKTQAGLLNVATVPCGHCMACYTRTGLDAMLKARYGYTIAEKIERYNEKKERERQEQEERHRRWEEDQLVRNGKTDVDSLSQCWNIVGQEPPAPTLLGILGDAFGANVGSVRDLVKPPVIAPEVESVDEPDQEDLTQRIVELANA